MTAAKVETVAREMYRILADSVSPKDREFVTDLARWHLREIAKAERRGTVAKVRALVRDALADVPAHEDCARCGEWTHTEDGLDPTAYCNLCAQALVQEVARVVLVPKRKKPKRLATSSPRAWTGVANPVRVKVATRRKR